MRRLLDRQWVDEQLPRDYWEKLDRKRVMKLRSEMRQGTVELDKSEAAKLAKVDGRFAKALASEWGRWKGLVQSSLEGEHQFAKRRHEQDRKALKKAVEEAAAQNGDERLKNSARRILDGTTLLYALTPTPDGAARALAAGKLGMRAFLGYPYSDPMCAEPIPGHILDDEPADYDWDDVTNNSRVVFDSPDAGAFKTPAGGKIFVMEPSRVDSINALRRELGIPGRFDPVKERLTHESQHDVDRIHSQKVKRIRKRKLRTRESQEAAAALAEYQTEFRAYAAQEPGWLWTPLTGREEQTLERLGLSFTDRVQAKIFLHIYMRYPSVKQEWDKTTPTRKNASDEEREESRRFRDAILATRGGLDRVSANPSNSPRVERFWPALHKANKRDEPQLTSGAMSALVIALKNLDDNERAALRRNAYYQRVKLRKWLRATVDAVLNDPGADVAPILDAEQAKRAEANRQQEEERRRAKPPGAEEVVAAKITTWEDMEELLKTVKTSDGNPSLEDPRLKEPLELRTLYPSPSPRELGFFLMQVSSFLDLWPALDERREH